MHQPFVQDYAPYTKGQLNRLGSDRASLYLRKKVESEAGRNWDIFYKNNGDRFFKHRHWITREFIELRDSIPNSQICLMEVGCGVGNTCK